MWGSGHHVAVQAYFTCVPLHFPMVTVPSGPCVPRNTAVESVEQELLFVGTENGKLLAVRDLIKKVASPWLKTVFQPWGGGGGGGLR